MCETNAPQVRNRTTLAYPPIHDSEIASFDFCRNEYARAESMPLIRRRRRRDPSPDYRQSGAVGLREIGDLLGNSVSERENPRCCAPALTGEATSAPIGRSHEGTSA